MKIKLSDLDRTLIANLHRSIPWQGTEDVVVRLYELGETLGLTRIFELTKDTPLEKLAREPSFLATLTREQGETLIALVAGGGQAVKGDMGPLLGELVVRLRKTFPRKVAPA